MRVRYSFIVLVGLFILNPFFTGCENEEDIIDGPPPDYVALGWYAWEAGDYDKAKYYFGNALKLDENYMPAYNGLGWTYMRLQYLGTSADYLQDGILYGASYSDFDSDKRALYVGLTYTLLAADDFNGSIIAGEAYLSMDPPPETIGGAGGTWVHSHNARFTAYDVYIILALDYFAEGDSYKCVNMVHYMQRKLGDSDDYVFTTWADLAAKIEEMAGKDPS
jgi:tetratricopeptide (TPR) repeat protein